MKLALGFLALVLLLAAAGGALAWLRARRAAAAHPPGILFSRLLMELSFRHPVFIRAALARLCDHHVDGVLLDARQVEKLRLLILNRQWDALDFFPMFTILELECTIRRADLERREARGRPVLSLKRPEMPPPRFAPLEPLGLPTRAPIPPLRGGLKKIGAGLALGEELDPALARYAPDSLRLAELLNRLALNPPDAPAPPFQVEIDGRRAASPHRLVELLLGGGHDLEVRDGRYFANFGDLIYQRRDVITPFWLDTRIPLPGTGRLLRVPVTHSEHEFALRGPRVNAELAFFFGADGRVAFRPNVARNQAWICGRIAHRYRGAEALEAVRLAGAIIRTYGALQQKAPNLPLGGYLTLGVCNDVNAALELHLTGRTTIFPLTRNPDFFYEGDGEVERLMRRLPVDGRADAVADPTDAADAALDLGRLLDALPVDALAQLPWPELRQDLERARQAAEATLPALAAAPCAPRRAPIQT